MRIPDPSDPDRQRRAQHRVEAQTRHLQVCRWLDRLASLSVYYRDPKGGAYCRVVEGWRP
jgi:hypothetical protein